MTETDAVIVGCGPAGLSAAIFCARANVKTVVIGVKEKSQLYLAKHIENYFGFPDGIDGSDLLNLGKRQAEKFGASFVDEEIVSAKKQDQIFVVKTDKGSAFSARALIIASGIPIRMSGIKNEEALIGKGIHYCASCDGPLYKGKKLAVVGSGNHAAETAIELFSYTGDITIISNASDFDFSDAYKAEIARKGIKLLSKTLKEFKGEKWLESLIDSGNNALAFNGVFMACGSASSLDFASELGIIIENNIIVTDDNGMTNVEGIFAAGNCSGKCRQIAKNVGDGCNAAINVIKFLNAKELYFDYVHNKDTKTEMSNADKTDKAAKTEQISKVDKIEKKIRVGWFSFSCCEDSTIVLTEMMNEHYFDWARYIDICYSKVLRKNNDITNLDIAFVEGAIASKSQEEELKRIRENSRKLVAIGACAITGLPSAQRNEFNDRLKKEISFVTRRRSYREKVVPLHDLVQVDDSVPGCPMSEQAFLNVLQKYAKEMGIDAQL